MGLASRDLSRRRFLEKIAAAGGALALAEPLWAGAEAEFEAAAPSPLRPLRIRGRVHTGGRGLAGVSVSDGLSVAVSDTDGYYQLISDRRRPFVHLSLPSGFRIPLNPTGTARFYKAIEPGDSDEMLAEFRLLPLERSDEDHDFYLLADPQTQTLEEIRRFQNETVPDLKATSQSAGGLHRFGIACGDIMYDRLQLYPEYEKGVKESGVPFFQVVGNHDLDFESSTNPGSTATFQRHFGPPYYSFDRGRIHYVVLNDVFWYGQTYLAYLTAEQLAWLAADLQRIEKGRTVVVANHIPVQSTRSERSRTRPTPGLMLNNRDALYSLLEPYDAHIVSGHVHESEYLERGGAVEHICGAVCGAWWSGPICYDGTPSGYSVFHARGEELRWSYKSTGLEPSHQMRLYDFGADPQAPDEIAANVWNWDPGWKVLWYENGQRKGEMARRIGLDPLSVELHKGEEKPPKRKWVEPVPTAHMFYAPADKSAREIIVEAIDRFGNAYREALRR